MTAVTKAFSDLYGDLRLILQDSRDGIWTLAVKKKFLNAANTELIQLMLQYGDYRSPYTDLTVVANTQEYDLPAAFAMARMVIRTDDNIKLPKTEFDDYLLQGSTDQTGYSNKYYVRNAYEVSGLSSATTNYAKMGFVPSPSEGFTARVWYQPTNETLVYDTDVSIVPGDFHDLLVIRAAMKCFMLKGMWDSYQALRKTEYEPMIRDFKAYLANKQQRFEPGNFVDMFSKVSG